MQSDSILDGRLWPRLSLDHAPTINLKFKNNLDHKGHLANQLLLYNKIIFPTNDFGIVPILIDWIGERNFSEAIEDGSFSFIKSKNLLSYAGNGHGLSRVTIRDTPEKPFLWWQEAAFGDTDYSIELQLDNNCTNIDAKSRNRLISIIQAKTKELNIPDEIFKKHIAHETYMDVIENPILSNTFYGYYNKSEPEELHLTHLPSIRPDNIKFSSLGVIRDPVALLLRIAEVNLEIYISNEYERTDLFSSSGTDYLLHNKIKRAGLEQNLIDGFIQLLELNNLPDIEFGVREKGIPLSEIWKIRQTKESKIFRKWLRDVDADNIRDIEKAYVQAISKDNNYNWLPLRVMRFALIGAMGAVSLIPGLVAAGIDNFFLEKVAAGYSPKIFFDKLRKLKLNK